MILVFMAASAVLSFLICGLIRWLPLRDAPDGARKQQAAPVPTSGGVGILLAALACAFAFMELSDLSTLEWPPKPAFWGAALLVLAPFLIGLLDDWRGLPALVKLGLLVAWAGVILAVLVDQAHVMSAWVMLIIAAVGGFLLVFVNAANFMDGSNGLAVGCLALMIASLYPLYAINLFCLFDCPSTPVMEFGVVLSAIIPAAAIGFLVWNMAGKLYAGDAGALGLGGLFCLMAVQLLQATPEGQAVIWYALTVTLPFTVDVLLTLALRSLEGKNILKAHTDHAYQRLRAAGWAHWKVAVLWWAMTLACIAGGLAGLVPLFRASSETPYSSLPGLMIFAILSVLGGLLWIAHRIAHMRGPHAAA